jgi:putative hydrolase of the HAD superfamily
MFDRPPEIRSKLSGSSTPGTFASNHPSTPARSIPSGASRVDVSLACPSMSPGAYAAAIFDFGGVLTTSVWDSFAAFCREEGLEPDAVKKLFSTDPEALAALRQLEMGKSSEQEFEAEFGRLLGLENPEGLIDSMFKGMKPEPAMVEAVRKLRTANLKTGMLSNSWSTSHYDRDLLAELFDDVVISAEVQMHKPQPEIYELAAKRLELEPAQCLFVDDLRENCLGAEEVGMTAIRFHDPGQTIARLSELTGLELAPA